MAQRCELFALLQIVITELIDVDNEDSVGRRQLNQPQARDIRIEICCFSIESNYLSARKLLDCASKLFGSCDEFVIRIHCSIWATKQLATRMHKMTKENST